MKRTSSMALFQDSEHRVTRAQVKFVKSIFPFLHLPAELREMIYLYCFSFEGIEKYFDKLYIYVKSQVGKESRLTKTVDRRTPNVLLINRQIFNEAIGMIRAGKHSAVFKHGVLNTKLCRVIQDNPLRQLASIEISDHGHHLLEKPILATSWHGYMRLLKGLADVLEKGHNLKKFTVRFTDPKLVEHVTSCARGTWECGFRDQLRDACNALRKVRGIEDVNFYGIEKDQAAELKYRMQSKNITTFFHLSLALREKIYDYAADWSDASKSLAKSLAKWEDKSEDFPYPKMSTPTIFRINKQIYDEARAILQKKPLDLYFPADTSSSSYEWHLPRLLSFISRRTLRDIKTINITLEHWKWAWTIIQPLEYVLRKATGLEKLTITVKGGGKEATIQMPRGNLQALPSHHDFKPFTAVRKLTKFGVEGEVFGSYIGPLVHALIYNSRPAKKQWSQLPAVGTQLGHLVHGYERDEHEIARAAAVAETDRELAELIAEI